MTPPPDDDRRLSDALRAAGARVPVPPADGRTLGAAVRRRHRQRRLAAGATAAFVLLGAGIAVAALEGPPHRNAVVTGGPTTTAGGSTGSSGASGTAGGTGNTGTSGPTGTSGRGFAAPAVAGVTGGPNAVWALVVSGGNGAQGVTGTTGAAPRADLVAVDPATGTTEGERVKLPDGGGSLVAIAPNAERAYVLVEPAGGSRPATLIPVALAAVRAGAPITITSKPGMTPVITSMAFSPDGHTAYLTDAVGGELLSVDLRTGQETARIPVGNMAACGDAITHTAVTPDGRDAYIEGLGSFYDVALAKASSSPAFHVNGFNAAGLYGDPTIALSPDGSTLWALQSGRTHDLLVPIATAGDNAGTPLSVPVPTQTPATTGGAVTGPLWDGLVVTGPTTGYIVAYGAHPEAIVPVDLANGQAGAPIPVSAASGSASCGDQPPVPVAFTPDGTRAVVGDASAAAVHVVDLSTGSFGPAISVGPGRVEAILTTAPWSDWYWPVG